MPKSRHRKNQKKKAQQRTEKLKVEKKKQMDEFLNQLKEKETSQSQVDTPYNPNEMKNPYNLGK